MNFVEAASVPVVAATAWQMLFDYAKATPDQTVLIHEAGVNVGAYAIQVASQADLDVFATASADDVQYVQSLGATTLIDYKRSRFEEVVPMVDIVLDRVGGDTRERSFEVIKPGGILVVSEPIANPDRSDKIRTVFFLVEVTTKRLDEITDLFNRGRLVPRVGTVLPLEQARRAHEMLAGAPHKRGKIILSMADVV